VVSATIAMAGFYEQATHAGATCAHVGCKERAYFFAFGWHVKLLADLSKLQGSARHDEAFEQAALFSRTQVDKGSSWRAEPWTGLPAACYSASRT